MSWRPEALARHVVPGRLERAPGRARSSFLTVVMAAIFALSLVPTGAFASATSASGDIEDTTSTSPARNVGNIHINNPKTDETYSVYKLFDLASFTDADNSTDAHAADSEAYSYIIDLASGTDGAKWYTFLTTHGPNGAFSGQSSANNFPYAVYENTEDTTAKNNAYFWIEPAAVTINGKNTYHVVKAANGFKLAQDYTGAASNRSDSGVSAGDDITLDSDNSPKNSAMVQDFAQEALKYAATSITHTDLDGTVDTTETAQWTATLPLGYYLVGTTMGTLASLDTNNLNVEIYEKNDEPSIEKKVLKRDMAADQTSAEYLTGTAGAGAAWAEATDADVGDYVMFRTVVTAEQGAKDYVLHDVMEKGLTFVQGVSTTNTKTDRYTGTLPDTYETRVFLVRDGVVHAVPASITVTNDNKNTGSALPNGAYSNWLLKWTGGTGDSEIDTTLSAYDGCDFEIEFKDADGGDGSGGEATTYGNDRVTFVATTTATGGTYDVYDIKDGDKIVVTYWAQLNQNAQIYGDADTADAANLSKVQSNTENDVLGSDYQQNTENDGNQRNTNATVLCYGAKSHTVKDTAVVTTYQFDIVKTKINSSNVHNLLANAEFSLYKAKTTQNGSANPADSSYTFTPDGGSATTYYYNESSEKLHFANTGNTYLFQGDQPAYTATTDVRQLTSTDTGEMRVRGLESGTYILVEDKAPDGYNKLAYPIVITIDDDDDNDAQSSDNDGQIAVTSKSNTTNAVTVGANKSWNATLITSSTNYDTTSGGVEVINQTGNELPSTGGIGTTIFYVAGTVLVVGAAVMLVAKRRMDAEA